MQVLDHLFDKLETTIYKIFFFLLHDWNNSKKQTFVYQWWFIWFWELSQVNLCQFTGPSWRNYHNWREASVWYGHEKFKQNCKHPAPPWLESSWFSQSQKNGLVFMHTMLSFGLAFVVVMYSVLHKLFWKFIWKKKKADRKEAIELNLDTFEKNFSIEMETHTRINFWKLKRKSKWLCLDLLKLDLEYCICYCQDEISNCI